MTTDPSLLAKLAGEVSPNAVPSHLTSYFAKEYLNLCINYYIIDLDLRVTHILHKPLCAQKMMPEQSNLKLL